MSDGLVRHWLVLAADAIEADWQMLTELDSAIGDGDHGVNLDRGFREVRRLLLDSDVDALTDAESMILVGRTILGTVGGASGALYGRAFTRAGERLALQPNLPSGPQRAAAALEAAVDSIATLGRSEPGQKTMLDALVPALVALRSASPGEVSVPSALDLAAAAAERGAAATIPMLALRGRASYLGERSIGHQDPGATSSAILLRALADAARGDDASQQG